MSGSTKRRKIASSESGTLSPNPWDLTLSRQNVWCTVEGTRTEDRAPQGCDPSAASRAGMARDGFDAGAVPKLQSRPRRILAYCGRTMVLTMGSTSVCTCPQSYRAATPVVSTAIRPSVTAFTIYPDFTRCVNSQSCPSETRRNVGFEARKPP